MRAIGWEDMGIWVVTKGWDIFVIGIPHDEPLVRWANALAK